MVDAVIVDYKMGNLSSVKHVVEKLGKSCVVSSDQDIISGAPRIILPGVGHFASAMENISKLNLLEALNYAADVRKIPILGICLGMQLMGDKSEEGNVAGLGWIKGSVRRLNIVDTSIYKIPNVGWGKIRPAHPGADRYVVDTFDDEFYFIHSYHFCPEASDNILAYSDYEDQFVSMISRGNLIGVQFHPEKSHLAGRKIISRFLGD